MDHFKTTPAPLRRVNRFKAIVSMAMLAAGLACSVPADAVIVTVRSHPGFKNVMVKMPGSVSSGCLRVDGGDNGVEIFKLNGTQWHSLQWTQAVDVRLTFTLYNVCRTMPFGPVRTVIGKPQTRVVDDSYLVNFWVQL
jgi:hypothetical protein